jgi:N-acetylmuramoyl-L-alanine amidase
MARISVSALLAVLVFAISASGTALSEEPAGPLAGKIIALDAGHGGTELGATYPANEGTGAYIYEKDVNLAVVYKLEEELIAAGARVVLTREGDDLISSRRERVNIAIQKCKVLPEGHKCDALVSVHHNGSIDSSYDGLLVIYNEKQDLPLANAVHNALWSGLYELYDPPPPGTPVDEGLRKGGYGMTVYGHLVSVLTEAYYITNDWEAEQYCPDVVGESPETCRDNVLQEGDRVKTEAAAIAAGLINFFNSDGDDGNNNCPPGKEKQGKC